MCTCTVFCILSNQVQTYVLVRLGGLMVYYQKAFVILVILTSLKTKLTFIQKRSPSYV